MDKVDCIVIGAGVVGLAVARRLALSGYEVIVLESEGAIGTGISSRNSEVIHAGIYYPKNSLKALLCVRGRRLLYDYCAERGVEARSVGKFIVATDEAQAVVLKSIHDAAIANGVSDIESRSGIDACALIPQLKCKAALFSPSTGIVDSHAYMLALQGDLEAAGGTVAFRSPMMSARHGPDGYAVDIGGTAPMVLGCDILVNAAGLDAVSVAHRIHDLHCKHIPRDYLAKGVYFSLSGQRSPFSHLIYPVPEPGGLGIHATLDLAGQVRFGPDVEWVTERNYEVDPQRAEKFYAAIRNYWPGLQDGALAPAYSGIRPKISGPGEPAADFVIQSSVDHGFAGLVNLFGVESPGLTASLAIADYVVETSRLQIIPYNEVFVTIPECLNCSAPLKHTVVDLGLQPLANSYVSMQAAGVPDRTYPLHVRICDACLLVQVDRVVPANEIFTKDYAYFSSFSDSWLTHCRDYVEMMVKRFRLTAASKVVEIASNDGYLLQYVVAAGVPCLGVEPSANVAEAARAKGIPTKIAFFGKETAARLTVEGHAADLIVSNNVLAHVPDINDFVAGISVLLKPDGVYTVEFPHLLNMIQEVQFDTIYHEHFTYLGLLSLEGIFAKHGLRVFDIEEVSTHGGSLRLFVCHQNAKHQIMPNVAHVRGKEIAAGLDRPSGYAEFARRVQKVRADLNAFLGKAKTDGKRVVGYGAAAKGNTLFNYCGTNADDVIFVADRSPAKQNMLLPGSRIPVKAPEAIAEEKPDFVLIMPWNLRAEIVKQLSGIREWGGRFVTAIPEIRID